MLISFTQCKKRDAPIDRNDQDVKIGKLIDVKLKTVLDSTILDSVLFLNNYKTLDSLQNEVLAGLIKGKNSYRCKIIILKDSAQHLFSSTNGTLYISSGLLRNLESFSELQALILHQFNHVLNHDISDFLIEKYGVETFNMAALARDLYNLSDIENDVQHIVFDFMQERVADEDCDSIMSVLNQNDALPLAYMSLGLGGKLGNLNFFNMHFNYKGRVNELLYRAIHTAPPGASEIAAYHFFLSNLPS